MVSTHLFDGTACGLSEGDLIEALLASCSVPGLLPPVEIHGERSHVDGSLTDNLPVDRARDAGAGRVIAFGTHTCDRCRTGRLRITDVIGRAFGIAADCSLGRLADRVLEEPDVLLLRPDLAQRVYALDFSRGEWLVEQGYRYAKPELARWLANGTSS